MEIKEKNNLKEENKSLIKKKEKISVELNVAKWSIWQPSHSKSKKTRIFIREFTLPNGNKITGMVKIGYVNEFGILNTFDQKIFAILCKIFRDKISKEEKNSKEPIFFSLLKIAKEMNLKWGSKALKKIRNSLFRLHGVPIIFEESFYNKETGELMTFEEGIHILENIRIATKKDKKKKAITKEECFFKFNNYIIKNFQLNYTKPLFLKTILSFKNEIAQILYNHLDLIMADKNKYERTTKNLFKDLGLKGEKYQHRSGRKQMLEKAISELQDKPITTGIIKSIIIEETTDKEDYKIIVIKQTFKQSTKKSQFQTELIQSENNKDKRIEDWVKNFIPQTYNEEQAFNIAKEFDDLKNLGSYLQIFKNTPQGIIFFALEETREAKNVKSKAALFHYQIKKHKERVLKQYPED